MRRLTVALGATLATLGGASTALTCSPLPPGIGEVRDVHVDADATGRAVVTWDRQGEPRRGAQPRAVALGSGGAWAWADPVDAPPLAPAVPGLIFAPPSATDPAGNALAIWWAGQPGVVVAAQAPGGPWGPAQVVGAGRTLGGVSAAVGLGAGGHAVAVWRVVGTDTENPQVRRRAIQAADRSPDGTWSPEYTLAGPDVPNVLVPPMCVGDTYGGPAVAVDAAGNAVTAWVARDPEPAGKVLKWTARPVGGDWSAPVSVGTAGEDVGLAVDASGTALMTWIAGGRLRAAVRPPGGAFGAADDLGPAAAFRLGFGDTQPSVTFDGSGRALAVWAADRQVLAATRPGGGSWSEPVDLSKVAENPPPLISDVRLSRRAVRAGATALAFRMRAAGEVLVTVRRRGRGPAVRGVRTRATRGLNRIVLAARPLPPGRYSVRIRARAKAWAPAARSKSLMVLPPA